MKMNFKVFLMFIILSMIIGMLLSMQLSGVNAEPSYVPPAPTKTPLEIEMEIQSTISSFYMWTLFKWFMILSATSTIIWAILKFLIIPAQKDARLIYRDPETGMAPIEVQWISDPAAPWWKRVTGVAPKVKVIEDYSLSAAPSRRISASSQGLDVQADMHGVPVDRQLGHVRDVTKISQTVAAKGRQPKGMTRAEAELASGVFDVKRQIAETNLERAQLRRERDEQRLLAPVRDADEEIEGVVPVVEYLTYQESVEQSTPTSWIMGQATQVQPTRSDGTDYSNVGNLFTFDPTKQRLAIFGAGGGGKTESAAFDVIYKARHFGMHVLILDGKEGIDLDLPGGIVEHHNLTCKNLEIYMRQLMDIFEERWEYLKANKGMNNIYKDKSQKYKPIIVLIEEFGFVYSGYKNLASKDEVRTMNEWIDTLFRLARATGIIVVLVDQAPDRYSPQMRGGLVPMCFQIGASVVQDFKEYFTNQLKTGYFSNANVFYKAWHVAAEVDMSTLPSQDTQYLREDYVIAGKGKDESLTENKPAKKKKYADTTAVEDADIESTRRQPVTVLERPLLSVWNKDKNLKHKKWYNFCRKFVQIAQSHDEDHPMRKYMIAELCDRMAIAEDGVYSKESSDRKKSQAAKWLQICNKEYEDEQTQNQTIAGMSKADFDATPI